MAEDQTLEETVEDQTSEETAQVEKETPEETQETKEEVDYSSKFKASQAEAIKLKKELDELKKAPKMELPEDEKKIWEIIDKREQLAEQKQKEADEQLKRDLDELHEVHGEFNDDKLLKIVNRYGVYDDEGKIQWNKALELYERLEGEPEPKKKTPPSKRAGAQPQKEPYDIKGKSLDEIVEEAKRDIPK